MAPPAFQALWIVFVVVWAIAAFTAKRAVRREPAATRILHGCLAALGCYLLFQPRHPRVFDIRFVPDDQIVALCGFVITAAGIAFAFWARFTIGRNWSGTVTIKEDHRLIRTGPYRLVRHPIYSGILLAMLGTAMGVGSLSCLIGVAVVFLAFRLKWKVEEQFMQQQFGSEYVQYQRDVKAVIPGVL